MLASLSDLANQAQLAAESRLFLVLNQKTCNRIFRAPWNIKRAMSSYFSPSRAYVASTTAHANAAATSFANEDRVRSGCKSVLHQASSKGLEKLVDERATFKQDLQPVRPFYAIINLRKVFVCLLACFRPLLCCCFVQNELPMFTTHAPLRSTPNVNSREKSN